MGKKLKFKNQRLPPMTLLKLHIINYKGVPNECASSKWANDHQIEFTPLKGIQNPHPIFVIILNIFSCPQRVGYLFYNNSPLLMVSSALAHWHWHFGIGTIGTHLANLFISPAAIETSNNPAGESPILNQIGT